VTKVSQAAERLGLPKPIVVKRGPCLLRTVVRYGRHEGIYDAVVTIRFPDNRQIGPCGLSYNPPGDPIPVLTEYWREASEALRLWLIYLRERDGERIDRKRSLQVEEGTPPDPHAELRNFASKELKGKERAVIEALCDSKGDLPIADLAVKEGVDWDDPFQGFKDAQRRLNPKLKKLGCQLRRRNNAAILVTRGRKVGIKSSLLALE
jgi:hypothetical protein